jgi:Pectate lyase superfamily protein
MNKYPQFHRNLIFLVLLSCLLRTEVAFAQATSPDSIITASRRIDWAPGLNSSIPDYPVCANVKNAPYNAIGNGINDDTLAIQNAINSTACANGGTVFLPSGQYKITQAIVIQEKSIVLRGAGTNSTTIIGFANGSNVSQIDFKGGGRSQNLVLSGYSKDSTSLTLDNSVNFGTSGGEYIRIEEDQDRTVIEGTTPSSTYPYQAQIVRVKNRDLNSNALNLDRPLYYTYNPTKNIRTQRLWAIRNCGVENLKIDMRGTADVNISFYRAANCWVRNVESINAHWQHVSLGECYQCEVRHNYFHHAQTYGQGGYGISIGDASTDCLVEDNVFYYLRHAMVVQNGATGNVIGYNYSSRSFDNNYPNTDYLIPDLELHGGNPNMNLFEGNSGIQMMADNYWGSSRNNTYFRNYASRYSLGEGSTIRYGLWAVRVDAQNLYYNFVGNVLGRVGDTGQVWLLGKSCPYNLTCNISVEAPVADSRVNATLLNHGNVDRINGAINWDSSISTRTLRNSYYKTSKPAFFGNMPWPAIGPDVTGYVLPIPAQKCFEDYWQAGRGFCPEVVVPAPPPGYPAAPNTLKVVNP